MGTGSCALGVTSYEIGVFGHIAGDTYIGFSIDNNGVVDEKAEGLVATMATTCT